MRYLLKIAMISLSVGAAGAIAVDAVAAEAAKNIFGAIREPSRAVSEPHGTYARGCLAGAVALPESGPNWQVMRLSRNRNWGHPALLEFVQRLSASARRLGWPRLYIGDISQPRGGPMSSGHSSHQIGLDVDIWLRIPEEKALSTADRERVSSHTVVRSDGLQVNEDWAPTHHAMLKLAAKDPEVARIFVNPAIKKALCEQEPPGDREWLRSIRPWWGHDSHFHVRLVCPPGSTDCADQVPPPPGDGCGAELDWWFSDEARNPKPRKPEKQRDLALDDLPMACQTSVLQ